jgi:phospholipid/cholesterol/gamma-HCH transport system substrate-binding protein
MKKVDGIIDDNEEKISNIIFNLESILNNIEESNSNVNNILSNMSLISDSLSNSNLTSLINNFNLLMTQINSKEGSAGLLVHDDKLYHNLEKTTKELSELVKDIKDNPKRYINFSLIKRSNNK